MSTKPILFSGPMVRALLDGRKTQTRRLLKGLEEGEQYAEIKNGRWYALDCRSSANAVYREIKAPYSVGDLLWVRETWSHSGTGVWTVADAQMAGTGKVIYRADDTGCGSFPSIHMPRLFSRLTLKVIDVRVQRLQDISEEDAIAEGIRLNPVQQGTWTDYPEGTSAAGWRDPRRSFESLWSSINGMDSWYGNPWVVAISFTVHKCNVDQFQRIEAAA